MSSATENATERRIRLAGGSEIRFQTFLDTADKVIIPLRKRMQLATAHLMNKVIQNISRPVTKTPMNRIATRTVNGVTREKGTQYTKVTDRSVAGEFPKADTSLGIKSIMMSVDEVSPGCFEGRVGTDLDYMVILEVSESLDRSFLVRTAQEEFPLLMQILSGPIAEGEAD